MRAIVIGSGIGGLSCAIGLRKIGWDVALYERAPELREVGAGIMIWANGMRAFDALGVGESIRAITQPGVRITLAVRNGRRLQLAAEAGRFEKALGYSPFVGFIHRAELVGTLASHLPSGMARYGHECTGVELRERRVAVRFANGHADEADLLVGADGIRSAVRAALFGAPVLRYAGYTCWRGVCPRPAAIRPGDVLLWTGRGAQVGINTLTRDRVYWFATKNAPADGRSEDECAAALHLFRDWAEPLPELIATSGKQVIRADIIDRPPSRPWAKGRAVVVGDAAHPTTPNFGQGGGMAIEDAVVLARCLAAGPDPEAALLAFEAERYPRTSAVTNEAWRFGRMLQWESRTSVWFRDLLAGVLMRVNGTNNLIRHARYEAGVITTGSVADATP
jgi:2-polyprenyl-6-methoxyphenol hydroxylase-like FAD-dependent oxidoreductase